MMNNLYYRAQLDAHDQAIYDQLLKGFLNYDEEIHVMHPHQKIMVLMNAIHDDYPLLFYVEFHHFTYRSSLFSCSVIITYLFSKDETKRLIEDCKKWGTYIYQHCPSNMTNLDKYVWIHDTLVANTTYDISNSESAFSMLGVVREKRAVCEGISLAFKYLCDVFQLPAIVVDGTLHGIPHAWNLIWLHQHASFVDVTNDIQNSKQIDRSSFLRNSKQMSDYTWNQELIPECRISNKSDDYVVAYSKQDYLKYIKSLKRNQNMKIKFEIKPALSEFELKDYIHQGILRNPLLLTSGCFYSVDGQYISIKNK